MRKGLRVFVAAALALGLMAGLALAADKPLTELKARKELAAIAPGIKIISLQPSPVEGMWEVIFDTNGEKGIVYMDNNARFVILGQMIDLETKVNITKKRFDEFDRVDFASIPLGDALVLGNPDAKQKAVVFDDPD